MRLARGGGEARRRGCARAHGGGDGAASASSSPNRTPRARAPTTPGAPWPPRRVRRRVRRRRDERVTRDARRGRNRGPVRWFSTPAFMHKSSYAATFGSSPTRLERVGDGTGRARADSAAAIFVPPKARAKDKNESGARARAAAGVAGGGAGVLAFPGTSGSVHAAGTLDADARWTTPAPRATQRAAGPKNRAEGPREALLPLLSAMLRRASKCPYGALLDLHCPTPVLAVSPRRTRDARRKSPADAPESPRVVHPPKAVAAFSGGPPRRASSRERCSADRARARRYAFLLRLVVLRRFEQCTLHEAMVGVREREFPWLRGKRGEWIDDDAGRRGAAAGPSPRPRRAARNSAGGSDGSSPSRRPAASLHFYCTETESHRLRVFYYRKGVWARLTAAHLAAMTEDPAGETRASLAVGGDRPGEDDPAAATAATAAYRRMPRRRARLLLQRHLLGFARLRLAKGDGSASRRHARPPRGGVLPNPPRLERRKRAGGRRRTMEGEDWRSGQRACSRFVR